MGIHITQHRSRFFAFGMYVLFLKILCAPAVFHCMIFFQTLQADRRSLKSTKCNQGIRSTIWQKKKKKTKQTKTEI